MMERYRTESGEPRRQLWEIRCKISSLLGKGRLDLKFCASTMCSPLESAAVGWSCGYIVSALQEWNLSI